MARKKKNDFWDDFDETEAGLDGKSKKKKSGSNREIEEEWSATKCTPLKVIARLILMLACVAALVSGYIAYQYIQDRYAGGSFSANFYNSRSFANEYNKSVDQLLKLIQAMEDDPTMLDSENSELLTTQIENYMGKDTNFAFLIQDADHYLIASSGEDAKERIESSNHYALITNAEGESMSSSISGSLLNKAQWSAALAETSNTYIIYTAVDNELTQNDTYYKASQTFAQMEEYFNIAKFAGIAAAVIFIIMLIFCIMATGMKRGYEGVCLSWFDKIPTEIALVIMIAVGGGLVYADYTLFHMDGNMYQYAMLGTLLLTYIWIIRSYFSIVRRIKAGRLIRCSLIGMICGGIARGIGKLPGPLAVIVTAILLIAINGGLVYGILFLRQYTVNNIPIMFIVTPIVLIIELIGLLSRGRGDDEDDEEEEEITAPAAEPEAVPEMPVQEPVPAAAETEPERVPETEQPEQPAPESNDWEHIDLGSAVLDAEKQIDEQMTMDVFSAVSQPADNQAGAVTENTMDVNKATVALSVEEIERAIRESGTEVTGGVSMNTIIRQPRAAQPETEAQPAAAAEAPQEETPAAGSESAPAALDEGRVNFVQLNKDVRKEYRQALKSRGVSVTVRAPEKPVIIDIDRNSLHIMLTDIFTQISRMAADGSKAYVEVYPQGRKVAYIVRITVAESAKGLAAEAVKGNECFETARKIVEANDGRFVVNMEGDVLKAGMLIDAEQ